MKHEELEGKFEGSMARAKKKALKKKAERCKSCGRHRAACNCEG